MSREDVNEYSRIVVVGSRTIPTRPYGNEKWELTVERMGTDLDEDIYLADLEALIEHHLDQLEMIALAHVTSSS
jgi:hypothetical protein